MPQSLANILVHVIFSTKNRAPWLHEEIDHELFPYLASACMACDCPAHKIGGTDDHVHLVCSLSRTVAISGLVGDIKASSSKWLKTKGPRFADFTWQAGYGAFSIGQSQLITVKDYIASQREHHRRKTFQVEFRAFLKRYEVAYDERYVWD
jgi:REP element-mobilizing transposase RayT